MIDEEIPKYKKSTKSSVSKSSKKSNHKHLYKPCKLDISVNWSWREDKTYHTFGEYCTICGKVGNIVSFLNTKKLEEFKLKEESLETFKLSDFGQEYI